MNQPFSKSHKDPLTAAAASVLFTEDISAIKDKVSKLKAGDKTNFGVVKSISDTSIEFKARDTGVTKISFNQRKMGSKDFVLDKLMKLNEEESIDESFSPRLKGLAKDVVGHGKNLVDALNKDDTTTAKDALNEVMIAAEEIQSVLKKIKNESVEELDEEEKSFRVNARFNNKNAKGLWQKISWPTKANSKEDAEAKFRKRMGKDLIKDLEVLEEETEIEEAAPADVIALAREVGYPPTEAERQYASWTKRGLSKDNIKALIKKYAEEKKNSTSVSKK
jgi:hypothetical protein